MRKIIFTTVPMLFAAAALFAQQDPGGTVTISGRVTDFEGRPIGGADVILINKDFSTAYETVSDGHGYYRLENVVPGRYAALESMRPEEYPRADAVPPEDMRLEYWAWNVVADRDLTINPRYHKLELYGTTVFGEWGGPSEFLVYFRPMSVTKYISYSREMYLDKGRMEEAAADVSVLPEHLDVEVYAGEERLKINSVHPLYLHEGQISYLVSVSRPGTMPDTPYIIFRVVATNREHGETGENAYFYELKDYR